MKNKTLRNSFYLLIFLLTFIVSPLPASAETNVTDSNWINDTWTVANSPYIVNGNIYYRYGSLSIDPGVVVKFATATSSLMVHANVSFSVNGTANKPVYFTSIKDDAVGGDTNGDGNATLPASGDWGYVSVGGGAYNQGLNINYTKMRYGGGITFSNGVSPTLALYFNWYSYLPSSDYYLENIEISNSKTGLYAYVSKKQNFYVSNSSFYDNEEYGMYTKVLWSGNADANNNWWGDTSGPYNPVQNPSGLGNAISNNVSFTPWLNANPLVTNNPKTPVIIVPGILGSYLNRTNIFTTEVWPNFTKMILPGDDSYLNDLVLDNDGTPTSTNSTLVASDIIKSFDIVGFVLKDFFAGLIIEFENNGYQEGVDLFVFPYDWRLRNETNALALKSKVEDILQQTGADKVDIVAHSMGGLVSKYYIKNYGNNLVRKFVDIATPHLGAPKAFKQLMYGDNLGISILNQERMKIVSKNMPSIYQLLPNQGYFGLNNPDYDNYLTDAADIDNNNITGKLTYSQTLEFLGNTEGNSALVGENDVFYQSVKNWNGADYGVETTNIVGCGVPTIGKITTLNKELTLGAFEYGLKYVDGDKTIPLRSAEAIINDSIYYVDNVEHSTMPSKDGIKQLIPSIVNDSQFDSSQFPDIRTNKNNCGFDGQIFSVHSPVELHIYDSQNRHVGPTPNGDIEIAIPGAQYDVINNNKFAFLPNGGTYRVVMRATDVGSFNARIKTIVDTEVTETKYYNQIPLNTLETSAKITLSPNQTNFNIAVDQDGDNVFEEEIQPSSTLNENQSQDITKPETQISIDGTDGNNNWYLSDVQVTLTAMDDNSGVLKTEYSLDDGNTWNIYTTSLAISKEGETVILYKTTDNAGNIEIQKEYILKIDKTSPEAKIYFDPVALILTVEGTDNLTETPTVSSTTISRKNDDHKEKHEEKHKKQKGEHKDKHGHENKDKKEREHDNRFLTIYRIEDEAGNTLTLTFKKIKREKHEIKAELTTLQYNNAPVITLPKTTLKYEWSINKRTDQIKELEQKIKVKRQFEVKVKYRGKKDITIIKVREDGEKIKLKLPSLVTVYLVTENGSMRYSY